MSEEQSFYISGGTLGRSARSYVTRHADTDLLCHLNDGDFCYVLTSRQMGKSSLMVRTADALRNSGASVALLDLTRIGQNVSLEQWYGGLLVRLGANLKLEDELDEYWTSEKVARLGFMQRFMRALREVVLPATKGQVVIFVDEIDAVRSLPFSSDEFFAGIRECYNSRVTDPELKRLSFCLLGVAQPSDLISNAYITPFNIGHRIELVDFTEAEATPLLEGLNSKSSRPNGAKALLRRVLYWTGGHPYLTQKLCETLLQVEGEVTPRDVDRVCAGLFLSSRSREQQDNLIFVRDRVLASKEDRAAVLDLYEKVLQGKKVGDDDSNATIAPLRLSGLLVVANGRLKVRNRIYASVFDHDWITANMPDAERRRQKAAYRRGVVRALAVGIPVVAMVAILSIFGFKLARAATQDGYFYAAAQAQQAFNNGDIAEGSKIVNLWVPKRRSTGWRAVWDWLKGPAHTTRWEELDHWMTSRGDLERSYAMGLLRAEEQGDDTFTFRSQFPAPQGSDSQESSSPALDARDSTSSCGPEIAVATANFNGHSLVAAAGEDSSIQIWDAETGKSFDHLQLKYGGGGNTGGIEPHVDEPLSPCGTSLPGIMSLSFSPDGSRLAIGTGSWNNSSNYGSVWIWDLTKIGDLQNKSASRLPSQFTRTVDSVRFSGDDKIQYLAASSEDSSARVWKFSDGNWSAPEVFTPLKQNLTSPGGGRAGGHGANALALSPASDHLMALGFGDGHVIFYDYLDCFGASALAGKGASCSQPPLYVGLAHVSGIMSLVFLKKQGNRPLELAIGTRDGELLIEDPMTLVRAYRTEVIKARSRTQGDGNAILGGAGPIAIDPDTLQQATFATEQPGQGILLGLATMQNDKGTWLLTSGSNGSVGLWALTPKLSFLTSLYGNLQAANQAAFCVEAVADSSTSPGMEPKAPRRNGCIVSVGSDRTVRLWRRPFLSAAEMKSHQREDLLVIPNKLLILPGQAVGVKFLNDATHDLITAVGATAKVVETTNGAQAPELIAEWDRQSSHAKSQSITGNDKPIMGFDVSPDGKFLVYTSRRSNLVFVDTTSVPTQKGAIIPVAVTQTIPVNVTLSPKIRIRCMDDKDNTHILPLTEPCQSTYLVMGVADAWDFPGKKYGLCMWRIKVPTGGQNSFVPLGKPNSCDIVAPPKKSFTDDDPRRITMFDISAKGDKVVTSMSIANRTCVAIWNSRELLQGGKPDAKLSGCPESLTNSRNYDRGHNFDASFDDLSFSPNGNYLAAVTISSKLYYWPIERTSEASSNEVLKAWEQRNLLSSRAQVLAFSPYGKTLAAGLQDGGILLWDTKYYKTIMEIRQHHGGVLGLAFSPDGKTLASSGNDGTVRLFEAAN